jgi:glycosyltransferase involved in cell wall biosynthesis
MKVAIFTGNQIPQIGGGNTYESQILSTLLKLVSETKHSFVIYTYTKKIPQEILSSSIEVISLEIPHKNPGESKISRKINTIFNKLRGYKSQSKGEEREKKVLDSLQKNGVGITISLDPFYNLTMEIPYITVVWDLQHQLQPYFPEVSAAGEWEKRERYYSTNLRRASLIITGTQRGKFEIERFYQVTPERIKILPLPTPQFALEAVVDNETNILEKYGISENYLFYPAQFWAHKNHIGLLHAVKLLREKHNLVFPVVFVGSEKGNETYVKQMVTELELSQQVHFLGFVPQEDLIALYRQAFALSFVTFFGPDNLPPLEAMALGCPVVASKVSGVEEQLGDAALLVDPKDAEEIALAVKSIWEDINLRQTLIQRGYKRAHEWTTKDYVKGLFSILDDFEAIRRCWSITQSSH